MAAYGPGLIPSMAINGNIVLSGVQYVLKILSKSKSVAIAFIYFHSSAKCLMFSHNREFLMLSFENNKNHFSSKLTKVSEWG